jgi:hypothetical protein
VSGGLFVWLGSACTAVVFAFVFLCVAGYAWSSISAPPGLLKGVTFDWWLASSQTQGDAQVFAKRMLATTRRLPPGQVYLLKMNCDRTRDYTCALSPRTFSKRSGARDASQNRNTRGGFSSLRRP